MNMMNKIIIALLLISLALVGSVLVWQNKKSDTLIYKQQTATQLKQQPLPNEQPKQETSRLLNLSGQGLERLPDYVLGLTNLEELNISHNRLSGALPAEIRKLTKLKVLKANNNQFTGIPAEIGQLSELRVIDFSNNQLTGLPYELGNLKNLQTIDLSGNAYSKQDLNIIRQTLPSLQVIE
jgi:hypothetical protein